MIIIPQDIPTGSIVGINYNGLHDTSIAIVAPTGKLLFAMSLERLTREKQDGRPPTQLLDQIPWDRISKVALSNGFSGNGDIKPSKLFDNTLQTTSNIYEPAHPKSYLQFKDSIPCETIEVCHHLAHTHSSFWASGFDSSLCLTYDGGIYSNPWLGGLYQASRNTGVEPVEMFTRLAHPDIAALYSLITAILGFTPNKHEGKVTGLAAYGVSNSECYALLTEWYKDNIAITSQATTWNFARDFDVSPSIFVIEDRIKPLRDALAQFSKEDIAATIQKFLEAHILKILTRARENGITGDRICLAGGLFANVKVNQLILESGFKEIFIAPAMTDDGTALGAAWHAIMTEKDFSPEPMTSTYYGPAFPTASIEEELIRRNISYETLTSPAEKLATLLSEDNIVAVFQGNMEMGPRALGNRSILAQATKSEINAQLNNKLNRTEFMPFAPLSRVEDASLLYENASQIERAAAFMTITANCTDLMKEKCPAVVHVDGTARPQLVSRETNALIHEAITIYYEKTGVPSIVNTSFNLHEEPIVCTPEDALTGFFESGLDYLLFEDKFLISYADNKEAAVHILRDRLRFSRKKSSKLTSRLKAKCHEYSEEIVAYNAQLGSFTKEFENFTAKNATLQSTLNKVEEELATCTRRKTPLLTLLALKIRDALKK